MASQERHLAERLDAGLGLVLDSALIALVEVALLPPFELSNPPVGVSDTRFGLVALGALLGVGVALDA